MKKVTFTAFSLVLALFSGCKSPSSPEQQVYVPLDKNTVADKFGDNNGVSTPQELQAVDDYFAINDSAWCLQDCPPEDSSASVSAQQVKNAFTLACRFYPSEEALRTAFQGAGIKTVWVSIMVLRQTDSQIYVVSFYRSHGGSVASNEWTKLSMTGE